MDGKFVFDNNWIKTGFLRFSCFCDIGHHLQVKNATNDANFVQLLCTCVLLVMSMSFSPLADNLFLASCVDSDKSNPVCNGL